MQHNLFLSSLTETGLVGLSLLVALLGAGSVQAWRLWNARERAPAERWFGVVMLVFLVNYALNGMFHDVSIIPNLGALWYLLLGMAGNLSGRSAGAAEVAVDEWLRPESLAA
jgi:O-antigen ligase